MPNSAIPDITVGVMERPQNQLADFYRELGELFGIGLTLLNRYGSFKTLRVKWKALCQSFLARPVLLIDEAQEVSSACLTRTEIAPKRLLRLREPLFYHPVLRRTSARSVPHA